MASISSYASLFVFTLLCLLRSISGHAVPISFEKSDLTDHPRGVTARSDTHSDVKTEDRENGTPIKGVPKEAVSARLAKKATFPDLATAISNVKTAIDAGGQAKTQAITPTLSRIDRNFTVEARLGGSPGNGLSYYMNVILALGQLSSQPFMGIMPTTTYSFPKYTDVDVSVTGQPIGAPIQRRYVVWGLVLGLMEMMHQDRFGLSYFELKWMGKLVGILIFQPVGLPVEKRRVERDDGIEAPNSIPAANYFRWAYINTDSDLVNDTALEAPNPLSRSWNLFYNFKEDVPLTTPRFFCLIIASISGIAQDDMPQLLVNDFRSDPIPAPADHSFLTVKHYNGTRRAPPFFMYAWAVSTLTGLAELGAKRVRELTQQEVPLRELQAVLEVGPPGGRILVGTFLLEQDFSVVSPAVL